jgi:D-sedoheptulose 7-phosphate isomerase
MERELKEAFEEHQAMFEQVAQTQAEAIERIGWQIIQTLSSGHKLLCFGNGGSAADAQHLVSELVGRFERERTGLPAIALTTNASTLTSVANDYGYDQAFARSVEALARPGDLCLGISTSGNSKSIVLALRRARELGVATVGLIGRDGGLMRAECDEIVIVPHHRTCRIQEVHVFCIHVWCAMVDSHLP